MSESIFKNPYVLMAGAGIGGAILGAGVTALIKRKAIKQLKKEVSSLKQPTKAPVQAPTQAKEEASPVKDAPVEVEVVEKQSQTEAPLNRFDDSLLQVDISEDEEGNNFQLTALVLFSYIERGPSLDGLTERQANQMRAMASNRLDLCSKKEFVSAEEFRQHLKGMRAQYHRYLEQNLEEQNAA